MLHFAKKLRVSFYLMTLFTIACCVNPRQTNAQITDTIIMHDIGHDATAWWNSVCSWANSLNGGGGEFMQCQRWTWFSLGCGEGEQIPHIQFNLPPVPSNHVVQKVELQLFFPSGNPFPHSVGNNEMYVQRITANWGEATLTWNNMPAHTTTGQISVPAATFGTQTYTMDISNIAKLWYNGTPNYGVRLKLQNPTTYRRATFASSEHPDSSLHPRIYITYSPNYSISTTAEDTLVCFGDQTDIEVTTTGMVSPTFSWTSIPPGFSSTQSTIPVSPTQNTRYVVAVSDSGATLYDTVDIDVYNCCAIDTNAYRKFHKSFSGTVNAPHGAQIGGRADLTSSGDLLIASWSTMPGTSEALLSKINSNGNYNWTRAYDLLNYDAGLSTLELSTGEYLLVGHTNSLGSGKVSMFMQKVDANGINIIWTRIYDQTMFDIATAFVAELSNGDIVVAGTASSGTAQGIAIGQFDDSGFVTGYEFKTIWGKGDIYVNDILATSDGGFLLCGEAKAGLANDYDGALLMKFDDLSSLLWTEVYRYPTSSGVYNLGSFNPAEISITNAFSVLEDVGNQKFVVVGDVSDRYTFKDALIWEVNPLTGAFISSRRISYPGYESSYQGIGHSNTNSNYIMTGYLKNTSTLTELTAFSRCNSALSFNLHRAFGTPGVNTIHRGADVFQYPGSSDYLIHGRALEPFLPPGSDAQPYAIRTDVNGVNGCELVRNPISTVVVLNQFSESEIPNHPLVNILFNPIPEHDFCGSITNVCTPSLRIAPEEPTEMFSEEYRQISYASRALSNEEEDETPISIAPNPASTHINLNFDLPGYKTLDLTIVNSNGQQVLHSILPSASGKHQVDLNGLPGGLYIVNLRGDNQIIRQQKLIVTPR